MKTGKFIEALCNVEKLSAKLTRAIIITFVSILLLFFSPGLLNGQNVTEVREVEPFNAIIAGGFLEIYVLKGEQYMVEIEANPEIIENILTEVYEGVLTFSMNGIGRDARATARVILPTLVAVRLSGASSLNSVDQISSTYLSLSLSGASRLIMDLAADSLATRASGASNISLSGNTTRHDIVMSGASQLKAIDLQTDSTFVIISGAAHAQVSASELIDVRGSGTSRVTYASDPDTVIVNLSGVATIDEVNAKVTPAPTGHADGDTVRVRVGRHDLWVIEDKAKQDRKKDNRRPFKSSWAGLEIGINGYLSPENSFDIGNENDHLALRYSKSVAVNINFFQQSLSLVNNKLGIVTGLGLGFNNYRFDNQYRFMPDRDGLIPVLEERPISKNKITLTYLNVPLLLEYQNSGQRQFERFRIAGGMIVGARIGTHAKYVFNNNGRRDKEKVRDDFNIQPFRFDLTGRVGWGKINLFATYALNGLFKEGRGPELYPFSAGIQLIRF